MAVSTATASAALAEPKLINAGANTVASKIVHSGTLGDVLLMAKIPTGVDILSVAGKITTAATNANATVGLAAGGLSANTLSLFGSLASGTAPVFADEGVQNYRVSLSDDAQPRYTYLAVSPSSATWTATATVDLVVTYVHK